MTSTQPQPQPQPPGYAFDNDNGHAGEQHRALTAGYDGLSVGRLAGLGLRDGLRCLEVGAGGGSVARWLAARVAPTGSVLATDIKPHHIAPAEGLEVAVHDITRDPLPECAFDVIHARLVLLHLPERLQVLERLVRALRPGGRIQLDDFDETTYGPLIPLGGLRGGDAAEVYATYIAAKQRLLEAAGVDLTWGRSMAAAMEQAGLTDIDTEPHVQSWRCHSPGTALQIHNTHHLRTRFLAVGVTDEDLRAARRVMSHPHFLAASCLMYSAQGRRPY
ncbi:methyltransferase [Streptomyces inusitatus]|uniref:Methyltransferase n=1 Tax=Streptomyces inusitatus TaxID=68221 RepID=A0A918QAQ8_9ACTN|nr:methyltransferase [Streptomyces inusitatus]GGZ40039.1 methyltransferase [Streptomyces inusitatus]